VVSRETNRPGRDRDSGEQAAAKLVRGDPREAASRHDREETPEEAEAQGSHAPRAGTSRRGGGGLPEGANPWSRASLGAEAPVRSSQRPEGKRSSKGGLPLREGECFEGLNPTGVRGMKQGRGGSGRKDVKRARTLQASRARSGNPGCTGSRDRKRRRGVNPKGGAALERGAADRPGHTLKGAQGQESAKPEKINRHRRQRLHGKPRRPPSGKARAAAQNP
jgi:hypothetical protein